MDHLPVVLLVLRITGQHFTKPFHIHITEDHSPLYRKWVEGIIALVNGDSCPVILPCLVYYRVGEFAIRIRQVCNRLIDDILQARVGVSKFIGELFLIHL